MRAPRRRAIRETETIAGELKKAGIKFDEKRLIKILGELSPTQLRRANAINDALFKETVSSIEATMKRGIAELEKNYRANDPRTMNTMKEYVEPFIASSRELEQVYNDLLGRKAVPAALAVAAVAVVAVVASVTSTSQIFGSRF